MAQIAASLEARGHAVDVVLPFHPDFRYPSSDGVRFVPYRYAPRDDWSTWGFGSTLDGSSGVTPRAALLAPAVVASLRRRLVVALDRERYDVIHAHWLVPNGWAAASATRRRPTPLVVTLHGSDLVLAERVRGMRRLARRTLSVAGAVTTVSEDLRHRVGRLGANPATTSTVHLGIDTAVFAPSRQDPSVRTRLGAVAGDVLVLALGRLIEVKGFRYLIEAVSRLDGVHLAVVGDGDLRTELEQQAKAAAASVSFLGNLDQAAVRDAIVAADVVAVPSIVTKRGNVDGLPTTLLEALATGRAVVASAVGGIPEVVTHNSNGLLVQPRDIAGLAAALAELRDDSELRHRLGGEARRRAVNEFTWDETAKAFERAYAAAGAT